MAKNKVTILKEEVIQTVRRCVEEVDEWYNSGKDQTYTFIIGETEASEVVEALTEKGYKVSSYGYAYLIAIEVSRA